MQNVNRTIEIDRKKLDNYKNVKNVFNKTKKIIASVGSVATILMLVCPLDGPFGEIASLLAAGGLYALANAAENIYDNIMDIPNKNTDISKNFSEIANSTQIAADEINKFKNAMQTQTIVEGRRSK